MSENWNSLPEGLKKFKTPYSDLIIIKSNTEDTYTVRHFVAGVDQKAYLDTADGRLHSGTNFELYESGKQIYNALTDTWSSNSKGTYGSSGSLPSASTLNTPCTIDDVLYCTIDLYDTSYSTVLRPKDERVNCSCTDSYTLDPKILEINEIKQVFDPETDQLFVINDNGTYFYVHVVKNGTSLLFDPSAASRVYIRPSETVTVHQFTIKNSDTSYVKVLTSEKGPTGYVWYSMKSSKTFTEELYFTSIPIYSKANPDVLIMPAQDMIEPPKETLPEDLQVTPASIEGFIGDTQQLTVEVLPAEAEDKTVSFDSDKPDIASVSDSGLVELKAEGTAVITVQSKRVPEISKQVTVTSIRPFEKPVINSLTIDPATPNENEAVEFAYEATYDRSSFKAEEWENKQSTYEAGQHTVRVRVQDSNDLWSEWMELSFNVAAVYQEPTISNLRMSPANPGYGEAVEFTYDYVLDPRLTLQKENWTNKKSSYLDGNHTVTLSITDSEGQTSNELTISFSIERPYDRPSISNLRMTPSNPQPGETVSFSYDKALDPRLSVQSENWVGKQDSYEAGTHTVKLTITDSANQVSNELSVTFSIEQPLEAPVISNLTMTPTDLNAGDPVSFMYDKQIDPRLTLKAENWTNKQASYEAGQHTVKLTITDSADQVSNELSLTFDVAYVPEVPVLESISMTPPHPVEGEMVTFSYIALIDDQATMQEEIWENKRETYPAGDHEVALTIVDSFNQHSNRLTFNFHVEALPEPSPDPGPTPEPEPNPGPDTNPDNPEMPDEFPKIYDIVVDPPQPRAGELLSYSYTVGLAAGTSVEKIEWQNKKLIYDESGVVELGLKIIDSKGQEAVKTVELDVIEPSDTPQPPKPTRIKHLEVTRWDSASKRFLILEAREK